MKEKERETQGRIHWSLDSISGVPNQRPNYRLWAHGYFIFLKTTDEPIIEVWKRLVSQVAPSLISFMSSFVFTFLKLFS